MYLINTTIVSGFPAIGKTYTAKMFPRAVRDLESSDFHWNLHSNGEKELNPDWPLNYIDTIKTLENSGMYRLVFVSSHEDIRKLMAEYGIKYTNIFPQDTDADKKYILNRMAQRKSPDDLIWNIQENYSKYIESMKNDKGATHCLQINKQVMDNFARWVIG